MSKRQPKKIVLTGDDGAQVECQLLEIIDFEDRDYAVLLADDGVVIMHFDEVDDEARFATIEDDDEFNRVRRYIKALAEDV
jgi:hypothetical protein